VTQAEKLADMEDRLRLLGADSPEYLHEITNACCQRMFSLNLYEKMDVLTSEAIICNYLSGTCSALERTQRLSEITGTKWNSKSGTKWNRGIKNGRRNLRRGGYFREKLTDQKYEGTYMKARTVDEIKADFPGLFDNSPGVDKLSHWKEPNSANTFDNEELLKNADAQKEDFLSHAQNLFDTEEVPAENVIRAARRMSN